MRIFGLGGGLCITVVAAAQLAAQAPTRRSIDFTTSEGTWMSPDVSRDGRTIVLDIVGDLFTIPRSGGTATAIITGPDFASQPRFSPDGRQLVYVSDRSGSDNLWIAAAEGGNAHQLSRLPRSVLLSPAWSADGKSVLVTVTNGKYPLIPTTSPEEALSTRTSLPG